MERYVRLLSGREEGNRWEVDCRVYPTGFFHNKSRFGLTLKEDSQRYTKKYRTTSIGKQKKKEAIARWRTTDSGKKWFNAHIKRWQKTPMGRLCSARSNNKRQRNLGFHPISLPLNCAFEWHHVNRRDVVATPKELHQLKQHLCGDRSIEGVLG